MQDYIDYIAGGIEQNTAQKELCDALAQVLRKVRIAPEQYNATWHPYGFLVIRLGTYRSNDQVRLHIWPAAARQRQSPDWPVHSHAWLLESRIMQGTIHDLQYQVEPDTSSRYQLYSTRFMQTHSLMETTGSTVSCQQMQILQHDAGETYRIPSGVYHSTEVAPDKIAVTLVLMSAHSGQPPYVVGNRTGAPAYTFMRQSAPFSQVSQFVDTVIETLAN